MAGHVPWGRAGRTIVVAAGLGACWGVVYGAGGADAAALHLVYVPIVVAALVLGVLETVAAAAVAGLLMGPLMPLDVSSGTNQPTSDWLARGGIFVVVGVAAWGIQQSAKKAGAAHPIGARTGELGRALLRNPTEIISITDEDGRFQYVSPSVESMLGWRAHELIDRPASEILHREDLASVAGETVFLRARHRDGSWRHLETTVTPLTVGDEVPSIVSVSRDATERVVARAKLEHDVFREPITGLPDRSAMVDRITAALRQVGTAAPHLGVMALKVDRLDEINDAFGYDAGDAVLHEVGERLAHAVSSADSLGKGPDAFLILVERVDSREELVAHANRLLGVFEEEFAVFDEAVFISGMIGLAFTSDRHERASALLQHCHSAVRHAKRKGGNVALYRPGISEAAHRVRTEAALHRAIEQGELLLHYQPIVRLPEGQVAGVEALLRWEHPERGLIAPASFLPVAESSRLLVPIGRWVVHEASAQLAAWSAAYSEARSWFVSVNVGGPQLSEARLATDVEAALAASGLAANRLTVEVIEDLLGDDLEAEEQIRCLSSLGVKVAIDDFGTGHSSLGRLKALPVDVLKIDRSFVAELAASDSSPTSAAATIISSIAGMAHFLGLDVVAEGVEDARQVSLLHDLGCGYAQGFVFSEGLPAGRVEEQILSNARDPWVRGGVRHDEGDRTGCERQA